MKQNETSKTCRVIKRVGGRDTSRVAIHLKTGLLLWQIVLCHVQLMAVLSIEIVC